MSYPLTKEELLQQAATENLEINEPTFRKYVTYGLLVGTLHSKGGREGFTPATYERGMESLRLISEWKQRPKICKIQDMIFLLYIRGLPIKYSVLCQRLQLVHQEKMAYLKKALVMFEELRDLRGRNENRRNGLQWFGFLSTLLIEGKFNERVYFSLTGESYQPLLARTEEELRQKHPGFKVSYRNIYALFNHDVFKIETWERNMGVLERNRDKLAHQKRMSQILVDLAWHVRSIAHVYSESPIALDPKGQRLLQALIALTQTKNAELVKNGLYILFGTGAAAHLADLLHNQAVHEFIEEFLKIEELSEFIPPKFHAFLGTLLQGGEYNVESTDR